MDRSRLRIAAWIVGLTFAVLVAAFVVPVIWRSVGSISGAAQTSDAAPPPTTSSSNAADSYHEAVRLAQQIRSNSAEQAALARYEQNNYDPDTGEFFKRHAAVAQFVRLGSAAPSCEWPEVSDAERISQMTDIRTIALFTLARGRWELVQGNAPAAVDDVLAEIALARHFGLQKFMIVKLVELSLETQGIDQLALIMPGLSKQQIQSLPARLDALPRSASAPEILMNEFQKSQTAAHQRGNLVGNAMVDGLEPFYREIGSAWDQPPAQFAKTVDAISARFAANALAQVTAPSIKGQRQTLAVVEAKRAMLRTAIDVLIKGESAASQSRDPFGQGPFGFSKSPRGFELTSQLQNRGGPVKLVVTSQ